MFLRESRTFFLSLPPSENAKKNRRISSVAMLLELKMRARNMRAHTYIRAHEFSGAFRSRRGRCVRASAHKTLSSFLFFGVFFEKEGQVFVTKKRRRTHTMTERKSSRKTLTPKRFIPEETEKKDKDASGGQKSGGSKARLISSRSLRGVFLFLRA